jgi:hypothetical protein
VASPFNPADAPFRKMESQVEWLIDPKYFRHLEHKWGPHTVDLFAHRSNHQVPQFVSWKTGPTSDGDQRYDDELSQPRARAPLPTLEPAATNPSQDSTLTSRHADHSVVVVGQLVPNTATTSATTPSTDTTSHGTPTSRSHSKRPLQQSALVVECMENKLRRIEMTGVDENVTDVIMRAISKRYLRYAQVQAKFLAWFLNISKTARTLVEYLLSTFWLTVTPD